MDVRAIPQLRRPPTHFIWVLFEAMDFVNSSYYAGFLLDELYTDCMQEM